MLKLYLLRHAKSCWGDILLSDFDRPLSNRGINGCKKIADYLKDNNIKVERVHSSSSKRTQETYDNISSHYKFNENISYHRELYHADPYEILSVVRSSSNEIKSQMIIAHNPGIHACSLQLYGSGDINKLTLMNFKYPTAGLCIYEFDTDNWSDILRGYLIDFITPKML